MTNISQEMVDTYQKEGVVFVKGLFAKQVEILRAGIARNMAEPGPHAAENLLKGEAGRFFDDYCNWQRISEFQETIAHSDVVEVAAKLMR